MLEEERRHKHLHNWGRQKSNIWNKAWGRRNVWLGKNQELSKINDRHQTTDPKMSENPEHDKFKIKEKQNQPAMDNNYSTAEPTDMTFFDSFWVLKEWGKISTNQEFYAQHKYFFNERERYCHVNRNCENSLPTDLH